MVKVKSSLRAMVGNSGGMSFFAKLLPFSDTSKEIPTFSVKNPEKHKQYTK
jgi:hypothetical protein